LEDKPIKSLDITARTATDDTAPASASPIPRRKKSVDKSNGHTNGNGMSSSTVVENGTSGKKRAAAEAFDGETPNSKRSKVVSNGTDNDVIILDDDGAILIDDD
jgi:ubiquitin-like 1-activating enzyme E1 B